MIAKIQVINEGKSKQCQGHYEVNSPVSDKEDQVRARQEVYSLNRHPRVDEDAPHEEAGKNDYGVHDEFEFRMMLW